MTKRVLVWLSGGVDSAVSAYLLQEQGYQVVAGFMKNYADESNPNCHTKEDRDMAIKVAQHLGIQDFIIFDFRQEYNDRIISYIYDSYMQGLTPNPDILCNNLIKFDLFLEKAIQYGFDVIATGHYARILKVADSHSIHAWSWQLLRGVDHTKDQSYFLSKLTQEQLSKSMFPVGALSKQEVRNIAHQIQLPNADRKDSQGLCFIGNVSMKSFLEQKLPKKKGDILLTDGTKLGEHDGAWFRTIGQSRGLNINTKAYVVQTDIEHNIVYVSYDREDSALSHDTVTLYNMHRINQVPTLPYSCQVKIRYRQDPPVAATLSQDTHTDHIHVHFADPQRGIAAGQSVVVYQDDLCMGGGIIM